MPEFLLNRSAFVKGEPVKSGYVHPFYTLDTFAKGYVEAMFFTNGDTGDERENLLNDWGVEKLTKASVDTIRKDCEAFQAKAREDLDEAYDEDKFNYSEEQAGRDFWFTRQGHGVGFWDRNLSEHLRDALSDTARAFGECDVEAYRGWIYVR